MNSIVKYHLRQETPMWHFQCRQQGATLRGSDVKPRLDNFLIGQMARNNKTWEDFKLSPDHNALNYKLQIKAIGSPTQKEIGEKAFFANMGKNENDKEQSVYYPDGLDIKIICFIPGLMEEINKHIQAFFLIHNFGTRQDKGFGSFSIDKKDDSSFKCNADNVLTQYSESAGFTAYEIDTRGCSDTKILDNAYILYQWIKSGINFRGTYKKSLLTEYMLKSKTGGEKRWMKENHIAPKVKKGPDRTIVQDHRPPSEKVDDYKYIRAMLGVSGNQSWVTSEQDGFDRKRNPKYKRQEISVSSEEIERFQSPITIKVVGDRLFFIVYDLNGSPENGIFSKSFNFRNTVTGNSDTLLTPSGFNIQDLMDYCAKNVKKESISLAGNDYRFNINKLISRR